MTIEDFEEYAKTHNILFMTKELYETRLRDDIEAAFRSLQLEIEELDFKDPYMDQNYQRGAEETRQYILNMIEEKIGTPQWPKTGHWIEEFNDIEGEVRFTCSCCGKYQLFGTDFCYNCGAKMVEPQESEDKE